MSEGGHTALKIVAARHKQMNLLMLGLANSPTGIGDTPIRDSLVLVCLFAGIALLLVGIYLLFAGAQSEPAGYPSDPIRAIK